jgi:hypothetical protein
VCLIVPGVHALGGLWQSGVSNISTCLARCQARSDCWAVDFDSKHGTCWAHRQGTACGKLEPLEDVVHLRTRPCPGDAQGHPGAMGMGPAADGRGAGGGMDVDDSDEGNDDEGNEARSKLSQCKHRLV